MKYLQFKKWMLLACYVACGTIIPYVTVQEYRRIFSHVDDTLPMSFHKGVKTILFYCEPGDLPFDQIPYKDPFRHYDGLPCDTRPCQLTYNKKNFAKSDGVLFHGPAIDKFSMWHRWYLRSLRQRSTSKQIWMFFSRESPVNTLGNWNIWDDLFNWTITYRPSSDVFAPYATIVKHNQKIQSKTVNTSNNFQQRKSRLCLAKISNCNKYRLDFIMELKKYIDVDVIGRCKDLINPELKLDCPRGTTDDYCHRRLQEYKFYLAFENSFCEDYVTEKFYFNALEKGMVPVTLSGANFQNPLVAIPHSFINVLDFKDMKFLAEYLHYLDRNETAYNEYFWWKSKYSVRRANNFMCDVCKLLWKQHDKNQSSSIVKISEFWSPQKTCTPFSDKMFRNYL